jgi:hypothetical protein
LIQEEIDQKSVALVIKSAKLTARVLAKAMAAALRQMKKARGKPKAGRQSLRRLQRTIGGNTTDIEVGGRIQSFERFARKFEVSYRVEKNKSTAPPTWTVFFRTPHESQMMAAFKEYTAHVLMAKKEKPSVRDAMAKFRALLKNVVLDRTKNRERSGPEL